MTKLEFLLSLHSKLSDFAPNELEERLNFYIEMIEDRIEEGLSEEEAVLAVGSVDEIAAQIIRENPPEKLKEAPQKPKKQRKGWNITLLILGFPLWFPLLIAAFAVALSLYISMWSVIISLWAVFVSVAASALACILLGLYYICFLNATAGIAILGAGTFCIGLSIFLFFGCKAITKGTCKLTKAIFLRIFKKEAV